MAVNCSVSPLATVGLVGLTAIDVNAAAVTVRVSLALVIPPRAAVIAVDARGQGGGQALAAGVLEIVATEVVPDAQVTCVVRLAVEPSV